MENTVYADVIIKINPQSDGYTAFNSQNGNQYGFLDTSPIVLYNQGGYMSLTFRYAEVDARMNIDSPEFILNALTDGYQAEL